ncbi:hypothetical protein B0H11DRAFT_1985110 [Mycena galericulata]|nr:hypothetical protein B0H11DRAFT_1985110 [Mycena galericulata]
MNKSLSNESADTTDGPPSSETCSEVSASAWANTKDGRKAFSSQFQIRDETRRGGILTNEAGEALNSIVTFRMPSGKWLRSKRDELLAVLADSTQYLRRNSPMGTDLPVTRMVQARYLTDLLNYLDSFGSVPKQQVDDVGDESETSPSSEAALSTHFDALVSLCVQINNLRAQVPPPSESCWVPILNEIIYLATQNFNWAFTDRNRHGEPPAQAMPRAFARTVEEVRYDAVGLPSSFTPTRGLYIARKISPYVGLSTRQARCLTATKKFREAPDAVFPVIVAEYKAHSAQLAQANGQTMYSAVQAAAIFQNAACSSAQVLTLAITRGVVHPRAACWPGKLQLAGAQQTDVDAVRKADVCVVQGGELDLCKLSDVIALFLMVYSAARAHVLDAYHIDVLGIPRDRPELDWALWSVQNRLKHVYIRPGPLVDWRARKLAPALKRKRDVGAQSPSKRPRKAQQDEDGESESDSCYV